MNADPVVAVPADLEIPDRLVGPVTVQMAGWLTPAGAGVLLLGLTRTLLADVVGLLLVLVGAAGAFCRLGGRSAPAWLPVLLGYRTRTRTRVASPPGPHRHARRSRPGRRGWRPLPPRPRRPLVGWQWPAPPDRARRRLVPVLGLLTLCVALAAGRALAPRPVPPPAPTPAPVPAPPQPALDLPRGWFDCGC